MILDDYAYIRCFGLGLIGRERESNRSSSRYGQEVDSDHSISLHNASNFLEMLERRDILKYAIVIMS